MKYLGITVMLLLSGLLGYSNSQQQAPNTDDVLNSLSGAAESHGLNASALPVEEAKNLFKKKCDKNGGPDAFDNANKAQENMVQCLTSLINVTKLQADMEKYKPTGDLDIVFKEYCRKTPIFRSCVMNFTNAIEPCLEPKERENKRVVLNITDSLLDFVCFKEGDRIAIFISAGGPECFQAEQQDIQNCVNSTFSGYIPTSPSTQGGLPGLDSLPALVFGQKECTDIARLQGCVVKSLEKCEDPTPANIVDSIFNFILKVTPCKDVKILYADKVTAGNNGQETSMTISVSLLSMALVLLRVL